MTDEELKVLETEAMCDEPWAAEEANGRGRVVTRDTEGLIADAWGTYEHDDEPSVDAEMRTARAIVAAHNALPALIAALRDARRRADVAEAQWDYWSSRDVIGSRAKDDEGRRALLRLNDLGVEPVEHSPGWKR